MTESEKSDLKSRLHSYLCAKNRTPKKIDGALRINCPNPSHADRSPTAIFYENTNLVNCPVCSESWDIFACAELLDGARTFPEQVKVVQNAIGITPAGTGKSESAKSDFTLKPEIIKEIKSFPWEAATKINNGEILKSEILLERAKKSGWGDKIAGAWPYHNEQGDIIMVDIRFEKSDGKKNIISLWFDGEEMVSKKPPTLIYNLCELKKTDKPVLIVEGCKTAKAAEILDKFVAITWNGGSSRVKKIDWSNPELGLKKRKVYTFPDDDEPGEKAAEYIKSKIKDSIIIKPILKCREIKEKGSDIVEALQIKSPDELTDYILSHTPPPPPEKPESASDYDNQFPFKILGTDDNRLSYFLDRHGNLYIDRLQSLTKQKLWLLASKSYWEMEYPLKTTADYDEAIDSIIHIANGKNFNPDSICGVGAWRSRDGKICFNDGKKIHGDKDPKKLYIKRNFFDAGINDEPIDPKALEEIIKTVFKLSFEKLTDAVKALSWATIAPFGGALLWRPMFLLTGESGSGKSTIADFILRPLAMPVYLDGTDTTPAGIRGKLQKDSICAVLDECEADTPKKRQNRDELLTIIRVSASPDAPDVIKGTKDGGYVSYKRQNMFGLIAVDPTVTSVADQNRMVWINMQKRSDSAKDWQKTQKKIEEHFSEKNCRAIRARTWKYLPEIIEMSKDVAVLIQEKTRWGYRDCLREGILLATYFIVWMDWHDVESIDITKSVKQYYDMAPPEIARNEAVEIVDRLLDETIEVLGDKREKATIRQLLIIIKNKEYDGENYFDNEIRIYKRTLLRYGIKLQTREIEGKNGEAEIQTVIAFANNHHEIKKILDIGTGYDKILARHPNWIEKKPVSYDVTRQATILGGLVE